MQNTVDKLKNERHRSTTKQQYYTVWKLFTDFLIRLDEKPKRWEDRIILFVGYLVQNSKKSSTIKSYISAIKAVLWEDDIEICENRCLINAITRACRLNYDFSMTYEPVRKAMIKQIINKLSSLWNSEQPYLVTLYKAIFTAMYFGLFRIGELTQSEHVVRAKNVQIGINKKKLKFTLLSSKTHTRSDKPQIVKISSKENSNFRESTSMHCPFEALRNYLAIRPEKSSDSEQFFVFSDGSPVLPSQLRTVFKSCINKMNLNHRRFRIHGIHAGRAVDLLEMGVSVESIKKLGRWRSNAIYAYLT